MLSIGDLGSDHLGAEATIDSLHNYIAEVPPDGREKVKRGKR
jgi:hypothetical protein